MRDNAIVFKGTKEGLYIVLKEELNFTDIIEQLENKIKPAKRFFEGAKIVNFKGKSLSSKEYNDLVDILQNQYGMQFSGDYETLYNSVAAEKDEEKNQIKSEPVIKQGLGDVVKALFINGTIRSGQLIKSEGNIVVLGDVNPGAYLEALGSIIVMGNMRGTAHSGTQGDYSTYIAAFRLEPMQLRIGDIINRSPDGKQFKANVPEMALVKKGAIVVEPYLGKK